VESGADLVLHNGKVLTVDGRFSVAQAVAVRDGVIVAVGTDEQVLAAAGPRTRKIDLAGATAMPGLCDGHAHMDREGLKTVYPSLAGARSIADIQERIRSEVKKAKPGEWVVTMPVGDPPYYQNVPGILKEQRLPDRCDLDAVSPDNPVYVRGIWGYWGRPPIHSIANSRALQVAGITRDTPPPYDGVTIHKDTSGEPTGVFSENDFVPTLEFSLMRCVPRFDHAMRVKALQESMRRYNAAGTTSTYEGHGIAPEVIRAYRELRARDALTVRSHLVASPTPGLDVADDYREQVGSWPASDTGHGRGDAMLRIDGIFIQGGGNPDIARLLKSQLPYTGWGAYYYEALAPERFRDIAFSAARNGIRVNTIAPSQQAVDEALGVFAEVDRELPLAGRRWLISHMGPMRKDNIETMRRLGLVSTVITAQTVWKNGAAALGRLPAAAHEYYAPYRSIVDAGIPLVLASDNVPPRPFFMMWSAVARAGQAGEPVVPGQKLTREQALRSMTMDGARLSFEEDRKGSIEKGKYADFVVIREDYLSMPEDDIRDIQPIMTIVGGKVVHES
jgi:predicted amidohydrolase YtcJ